ncbi:MAG: PQQ-binding-like beta-propeller repeat protein [Proteobacteria bacterium]|nr:PQQ-binding-like beta-propeller repeat protein [Pseudomonadota bacterium]
MNCRRRILGSAARVVLGRALSVLALVGVVAGCSPGERGGSEAFEAARGRGAAAEREWRTYLGDAGVSHSSPLDAIDRGNVSRLEVAWSYDAGGASQGGGSQIQFNPLVVKGVLYGVSPGLRYFALDAATGEELWSFRSGVEVRAWTTSRGAVYWEDGEDERLIVGAGPYLYALDARSGRPVEAFGDGGRIDLREGLDLGERSDPMGVVATTPGSLFEDLLIMGGRVGETPGAAPGHVRAFDVRSGEQRWIFHTIPYPGEPGHETWPADAWRRHGGANVWAGFSVDAERGLVFAPTGSPSNDFFGGDRAGDNLFANTLLALDARTGERRWHFQIVRHDLWDRDLPAPPNLVEIERGGRRVPAVAQVTKTGDTFLFHRETGEPLFPLREEPVPEGSVASERPAASQPVPIRPPPFARQGFSLDSVTRRTPEAHAEVTARVRGLVRGGLYVPPTTQGSVQFPGTDGGAEWGGAAWDADSGLLYVNANQVPTIVQLIETPAEIDFFRSPAGGYVYLCAGCHGLDLLGDGGRTPSLVGSGERIGLWGLYRVVRDGRGRMPGFGDMVDRIGLAALAWYLYTADEDDLPSSWAQAEGPKRFVHAGYHNLVDGDRLPGSLPPWGTLTAIDLSAGEIRWQLPLGDYPRALESGLSGLGAENYGGPVVTAGGLLFIAATPDDRLRAFDKLSGELLWEGELPASGFATPASYEAGGRQFVVIAAGGGKLGTPSGSRYVAFALPGE